MGSSTRNDYYTSDLSMNILYVMCGVPGSGKTTMSKQMEEGYGLERFSFDEMRCFRLKEFVAPAIDILQKGKDVVLDSTNLRANVRKKILQEIKDFQCKKIVIYMNTSLEKCLQRNANREVRLQDFTVESTYKSLQPPTLDEGWDEIIVINNDEDIEDIENILDLLGGDSSDA